jgi:hypothetical protein
MKRSHLNLLLAAILGALGDPGAATATPQTTAFTYQGQLNASGSLPADQTYTFVFTLYNAATGGMQVGAPVTQTIEVVNGLFTADLDFGLVFGTSQNWLEVSVNGQTLTPRQLVTTTPVAQYALSSPGGAIGPTGPTGPAGPPAPRAPSGLPACRARPARACSRCRMPPRKVQSARCSRSPTATPRTRPPPYRGHPTRRRPARTACSV